MGTHDTDITFIGLELSEPEDLSSSGPDQPVRPRDCHGDSVVTGLCNVSYSIASLLLAFFMAAINASMSS